MASNRSTTAEPGQAQARPRPPTVSRRALRWPGLLLGLALGGFFDGILLHQILQWHHLLSAVDAARDLRTQLLADGLFHALMYLVAVVALHGLWRRRHVLGGSGAGASLWGHAMLGFGAWHVLDAVLSHWLLGIHRIRMDSPQPLLWDLIWLVVFGLVPLLMGAWMLRRRPGHGGRGRRGPYAAASLAIAVFVAGPIAALPPQGEGDQTLVLFAPGVSASQAHRAIATLHGRIVWVDGSGGLWAITLDEPAARWALYRRGALFVGNGVIAGGCVSWTKRAPEPLLL
jgi:uncharacterized membrane protein